MAKTQVLSSVAQAADASNAPSAGVLSEDVYRRNMAPWRFACRRWLLRGLEIETPWLARVQEATRHPLLDTYFNLVSLLGTHSSFLVGIPLFFWFGFPEIGITMLFTLSTGVYCVSALKDMFCVPRPFSPPVQRMTLVGSHAREYGWPSTHTTNAVSIALIGALHSGFYGKILMAIYAGSVIAGRIYCGMHSLSDCLGGTVLGLMQYYFIYPMFESALRLAETGHIGIPPAYIALTLFLITIAPQPVDLCPCFEDAVAFVSVSLGVLLWRWGLAYNGLVWASPKTTPMTYGVAGWIAFAVLKIVVGIPVVLAWRIVAKQIMHLILPPIIRITTPYLYLPRRHYEPSISYDASYSKIPITPLDTVPSAIRLPGLADSPERNTSSTLNKPRRKRGNTFTMDAPVSPVESPPALETTSPLLPTPEAPKYDADVLTKVVVYAGVGAIATMALPMAYESLGWSA